MQKSLSVLSLHRQWPYARTNKATLMWTRSRVPKALKCLGEEALVGCLVVSYMEMLDLLFFSLFSECCVSKRKYSNTSKNAGSKSSKQMDDVTI